jgi:hypothetical protein
MGFDLYGLKPEKKCSICNEVILPTKYWNGTHNAHPVNEGRCCSICNDTIVTPVRIMMFFKDKQRSSCA